MARVEVESEGERKGEFLGGKYLLEECLGIGGMGEVYRATNVSLGKKVAIKVLNRDHTSNEDDVLRFLREARAVAAVHHPNVVDVFDVARDDNGTPFIVQELLSGEDLEVHLHESPRGRISVAEALEIMIPVADGVAAAHARNVVHRDLKPANIFLAREGRGIVPKVLDFGACLYQTMGALPTKEQHMLIGTPHYMAPEQIVSSTQIDPRVDVWAMGVILYEMLVGETPFESEDSNVVLKLVRARPIPALQDAAPDVPRRLADLVRHCLERDRAKRLTTAALVREELVRIQNELSARAEGEFARPRHALRVPSLARDVPSPDDDIVLHDNPFPKKAERTAADVIREAEQASLATAGPDRSSSFQGGVRRGFDFDGDDDLGAPLELDLGGESSPTRARLSSPPSSLPPILAPSKANRTLGERPTLAEAQPPPAPRPNLAPPLPPVISPTLGHAPSPPAFRPPSSPPLPLPSRATSSWPSPASLPPPPPLVAPAPVVLSVPPPARSPFAGPKWKVWTSLSLGATVLIPAFVAFALLLRATALIDPLGQAMRGDSPITSGVFAVLALLFAGGLAAKALGAERGTSFVVAAGGAVLLGIVMIIVTFSASDSASVDGSPAAAVLVPWIAPIGPLSLAFAAFRRARAMWLSPYERREAIAFALGASGLLLLALVLGPLGATDRAPPKLVTTPAVSP